MQSATIFSGNLDLRISLPDPTDEVLPGVKWGLIEAFPTPAYWAFQTYAQRLENKTVKYKLGKTLIEEIAACLLGGHGIPAAVGVAAFIHLRDNGVLDGSPAPESKLHELLKQPLSVNGRSVHYRFARQKAKYLAHALETVSQESPPTDSGKSLRNWLVNLPGIGYKTASWIARNWLDADDVAILDIHIYRAGVLVGFFDPKLTVEKNYLELEERFLEFCEKLCIPASELDALIWHEMMSSPRTVHRIMKSSPLFSQKGNSRNSDRRTHKRQTNPCQAALFT